MTTPNWLAIQSENPGLTIDPVTLLGEGWGARAYRVHDDLVFKLPKRADEWDECATEIAVLNFVGPHLPLTVPKPLVHRQMSAGWPHGYAVYTLVPGEPLSIETLTGPEQEAAAVALGEFLRALHTIRPDQALTSILPGAERNTYYREIWSLATAQVLPQLPLHDASVLRAEALRYLDNPLHFDFHATLIHGDLHQEHLLTQEGVVTGIIDFGGAALDDPDRDFSDLYLELGAEFTMACARAYGHPNPHALIDKLHHRALFGYLHDIMYGPEFGLSDDVEAAWTALNGWIRDFS